MPIVAVQHTHVLVVILFLILFLIKAFMLFTNKHQALEKMKKSTKVLDMIFGTLILLTGGYLLFQYHGIPTWLVVKIVLVLVAIPLAIIGLKKHNKPMVALSVALFIYVYGVAETKSLKMKPDYQEVTAEDAELPENLNVTEPPVTTSVATPGEDEAVNKMAGGSGQVIVDNLTEANLANAKAIYTRLCASCHGEDGRKGLAGAKDLSQSRLSQEQQKQVIANGRGLMQPFKEQLNDQEIEALAAYTVSLKK